MIRDATNRPDCLFISTKGVKQLKNQHKIDLDNLLLVNLSDSDPIMVKILQKSLCALEIKSSARYYDVNRLNFIIDSARKERYERWKSNTSNIGALIAWVLFDKVFITAVDEVIEKRVFGPRTYERRGSGSRDKDTYNLPFEQAYEFATVDGIELGKTLRPVLERQKSGALLLIIEIDTCRLKNVKTDLVNTLAEKVKRP